MNARASRGVALLDLTIAFTVLSCLFCALSIPAGVQIELQRESTTARAMGEIKQALAGYVLSHGRLPCPAQSDLPTGTPNAGIARQLISGDCDGGYTGVVPWVTLGVAETDAWGRRITYHVIREYADGKNECGGDAARSICLGPPPSRWPANRDSFEVRDRLTVNASAIPEPIASGVAVVLISHGANGLGAYNTEGARMVASPGGDERANATSGSVSFFTRIHQAGKAACNDGGTSAQLCGFDDQVEWLSRAEILRRLIGAAGGEQALEL